MKCRWWCILLGSKVRFNLDSILKSKDITLPIKVHLVKAMVFPVVRYGCQLDYKESWVSKNWCFWIVVLEKTLESPLDYKEVQPVHPKGNQSWVFIGRTDVGSELQYFGHLMQRADSFEKALMFRKIEGRRRREQQRMRWLDGIIDSIDMSLGNSRSWWWTGRPAMQWSRSHKDSDTTEHLNWTELNWTVIWRNSPMQ